VSLQNADSNQRDELTLGFGVALDIALRHGQADMPGELGIPLGLYI
jgi:hypothetical protein